MNVRSAAPERAGREKRQRHRGTPCAPARAEARRGLEVGAVQPREARPREEVEVDVHRVRVHEEDGGGAREPPGRLLEPQDAPGRRATRSRSRRRERETRCTPTSGGSTTGSATRAPRTRRPGNSVRSKRNASGTPIAADEDDRRERDPEARPERLPLGRAGARTPRSGASVQRGAPSASAKREEERIADEPEEEEREKRPRAAAGRAARSRRLRRGRPAGTRAAGRRDDEHPIALARRGGGARTSTSPAASVATRKYATRPA